MLGVEGKRALEEADDGGGALACVDLGVGEPGVVVDDRVREAVAGDTPKAAAAAFGDIPPPTAQTSA